MSVQPSSTTASSFVSTPSGALLVNAPLDLLNIIQRVLVSNKEDWELFGFFLSRSHCCCTHYNIIIYDNDWQLDWPQHQSRADYMAERPRLFCIFLLHISSIIFIADWLLVWIFLHHLTYQGRKKCLWWYNSNVSDNFHFLQPLE